MKPKWKKIIRRLEKKGLKTFTNVGAWTTGKNGQSERSYETSFVGNNDDGFYAVEDRVMTIKDTNFRNNFQQTKQALHDTDFWRNMEEIASSSNFFGDSKAKKILQPTRGKTIVRPKNKTPVKVSKQQKLENEQVTDDSHAEEISTRAWETLRLW